MLTQRTWQISVYKCNLEKSEPFRIGMKAICRPKVSTGSTRMVLTDMQYDQPMSELGKGHNTDMSPYHLLHKAENGLGSDILPWESRECASVEIKHSVVEAGSHETLVSGSSLNNS